MLTPEEAKVVTTMTETSAKLGEPWLSFYAAQAMEHHLRDVGFDSIVHFGPDDAADRYLRDRPDVRMRTHFGFIHAQLSPKTPL
jgi:O-methyltransferase involved in polyketide biosynthesis